MDLRYDVGDKSLKEYFDDRGALRFRRLGLSFVAKNHPEVQNSFGSRTQGCRKQASTEKKLTPKAYFLATEALERDLESSRQRSIATLNTLRKTDLYRFEDVQQRQVEILFNEVPDFEQFIPKKVRLNKMLPADIDREEERKEAQAAVQANTTLFDTRLPTNPKVFEWFLRPTEAALLVQIATSWIHAAYAGSAMHPIGIDRPTFCRFLLDVGLVDQSKVTLFWATSLFDEVARPMRSCAVAESRAALVPIVPTVNLWLLASVLDMILRQLLPIELKTRFLLSLWKIAKLRLPAYVVEESDLKEELFTKFSLGQLDMAGVINARAKRTSAPGDPTREANASGQGLPSSRKLVSAGGPQFGARDVHREECAREFRIHAMLVEPEVLHLVMSKQSLWQSLYDAYADGDAGSHMSFQALHQFCADFQLIPEITSSHYLLSCYKTSQAASIQLGASSKASTLSTPDGEGSIDSPIRKRTSPWKKGVPGSTRQTSRPRSGSSVQLGLDELSPQRPSPKPGAMRRRPSANRTPISSRPVPELSGVPEIFKKDVDEKDNEDQMLMSESASENMSKQTSMNPEKLRAKNQLEPQMPEPWKSIADAAERQSKRSGASLRLVSFTFGMPAFVEALCRITFRYLGSYGNTFQQSSGGYARVVWLLSYLRCVYDYLSTSLAKQPDSKVSPGLREVLSIPADKLWDSTTPTSLGVALQPTIVKPKLLKEEKPSGLSPQARRQSRMPTQVQEQAFSQKRGRRRSVTVTVPSKEVSKGSKVPPISSPAARQTRNAAASGAASARSRRPSFADDALVPPRSSSVDNPKPQTTANANSAADSSDEEEDTTSVISRSTSKHQHLHVGGGRRVSDGGSFRATLSNQQVRGSTTQPEEVLQLAAARMSMSRPGTALNQDLEVGQPFVVDGHCKLCGMHVSETEWGYPDCRGCALTDRLPLEKHLFKSFMMSTQPYSLTTPLQGPEVDAGAGLHVENMPLTPPVFGSCHGFRRCAS